MIEKPTERLFYWQAGTAGAAFILSLEEEKSFRSLSPISTNKLFTLMKIV